MTNEGRPTDFRDSFVAKAKIICERGATDDELAEELGVSTRTLYRWKHTHPEFCQAIMSGKEIADERVERSLYQAATGYRYVEQQAFKVKTGQYEEDVKVVDVEKHKPAETPAAVFWLKNRRSGKWKDKSETAISGDLNVTSKDQRDAAVAAATRADS